MKFYHGDKTAFENGECVQVLHVGSSEVFVLQDDEELSLSTLCFENVTEVSRAITPHQLRESCCGYKTGAILWLPSLGGAVRILAIGRDSFFWEKIRRLNQEHITEGVSSVTLLEGK